MQAFFGFGHGVARIADEHIGTDAFGGFGETGSKETARRIHERQPVVGCVVGKKYLLRSCRAQEIHMPILQAGRFEPAGELNTPQALFGEHGEDGADVALRTGQQIVVENVAAFPDGQFPQRSLALWYAAEPAAIRAAPRGDDVSRLQVHAGGEVAAGLAGGGAAKAHRGDLVPGVGQALRPVEIPGEGDRDVDGVNFPRQPPRCVEEGQVVGGAGLGFPRENPSYIHVYCPLSGITRPPPGRMSPLSR